MGTENLVSRFFSFSDESVDCVLLYNSSLSVIDPNFLYFTGFERGVFEGNPLIVRPDGGCVLITSELEVVGARSEVARLGSDVAVKVFGEGGFSRVLKKELSGFKRVGFNADALPVSLLAYLKKLVPRVEFIDVSASLSKARAVKTSGEISKLRRACVISSKAFDALLGFDFEGVSELRLAAELNYLMGKRGCVELAFPSIVAFGKNASEPHYFPSSEVVLSKGDFVLMDFGCRFKNYCGDLARTFFYGSAGEKQTAMYAVVREAQRAALDAVGPGVNAMSVDSAARSVIDSSAFKGRFIHGTGHSVGLVVHDGFGINSSSDFELEPGMVFTVEPGVYVPGFGGVRIEDVVVVTKTGSKVLTTASKDFIEI